MELDGNAGRDVLLAIGNNEEHRKFMPSVVIARSGVLPNINPVLLPKKPIVAAEKAPRSSNKSELYCKDKLSGGIEGAVSCNHKATMRMRYLCNRG